MFRAFLIIFFLFTFLFSLFVSLSNKNRLKNKSHIVSPLAKIQENTNQIVAQVKQHIIIQISPSIEPTNKICTTSTPTIPISSTPTKKPIPPMPTDIVQEWGVAKQIDEHTWTMKIGEDEKMGTPEEIFLALNSYRSLHGSNPLSWNEDLARYAQTRVDHYAVIGQTDKHEGFMKFAEEPNNVRGLGFNALGENSSQGFKLNAIHLIEWMYAGDEPHNKNQLNPEWTHVGIAVKDTFTELIFGGRKI